MTVQLPDRVYCRRRKYELVCADSDGLFKPEERGFELFAPHTACLRGFVATYSVKNRELLLRNLDCSINLGSATLPVGGHLPVESSPRTLRTLVPAQQSSNSPARQTLSTRCLAPGWRPENHGTELLSTGIG